MPVYATYVARRSGLQPNRSLQPTCVIRLFLRCGSCWSAFPTYHSTPGAFHDYLWLNRHRGPRFYPNAVTLSATSGVVAQLAAIHDLVAVASLTTFAVTVQGRGATHAACHLDSHKRMFFDCPARTGYYLQIVKVCYIHQSPQAVCSNTT